MAFFAGLGSLLAGAGKVAAVAKSVEDVGLGGKLLPQAVQDIVKPKGAAPMITGLPTYGSEIGQSTAISVSPAKTQATETAMSGELSAVPAVSSFFPALPGVISRAPQIGRTIRDVAVGVGATQLIGGSGDGMGIFNVRINDRGTLVGLSRKEQRQAKQLVELVGFDQAADMIGVNQQVMAMILLKKFSSGGKGITAAQLRNAQRVNNRIVHMHKALEQSFKKSTTAARRRTTATRVTQIKN